MIPNRQLQTFISYSRVNQQFAIRLASELKSSGFSIWMDQFDIPTGARWDDEIEKALRECEIFLIILTPDSIASENAKDEIGYAIDHGKRILPVLLEECEIPLRLRRVQYVDFTRKSFNEGINGAKELLSSLVNEMQASSDDIVSLEGQQNVNSAVSEPKTIPTRHRSASYPVRMETQEILKSVQRRSRFSKSVLAGMGAIGALIIAGFLLRPVLTTLFSLAAAPSQTPTIALKDTAVPTFTLGPTKIPVTLTPETVRSFTENFDTGSRWDMDWSLQFRHDSPIKEKNFNYEVTANGLTLDLMNEYIWGYFFYNGSVIYDNVEMEVAVEGLMPNATLGLVCHYGENGWYEFDITGGGEYYLRYVDNMESAHDEAQNDIRYGAISNFRYSNLNISENTINATCNGKILSLAVNGATVLDRYPSRFAPNQGQIGIAARSYASYPINFTVKSIKVMEP